MSNEKPVRRSLLDMGVDRFAGEAPIQEWAVKGPEETGGLLPAAQPALIIGPGGVGKTRAAMELCYKTASWNGKGTPPTWMGQDIATTGVAVVLTYEESTDNIHRSIKRMAEAAGVNPKKVGQRMMVKSYQDVDVVPMPLVATDPKTRMPVPTPEYKAITEELRQIRQTIGEIGVIVIDNIGTAFAVEGNDYQTANQAMKWIQRWAAEFGALVLVVAHTNKGALKLESDMPSVNELQAATMGSVGWVTAVRAAIAMWTLSDEGEEEIARSLGDEDFKPGVTKNRYVRARAVKENVEGVYMGALTLKRAGGTLEDVSKAAKGAKVAEMNDEIQEFAAAVGRMWAHQTPVQKSGTNGVFERRAAMGKQFLAMSKSALATLTDRALAAGALRLEATCPGVEKSRGAWLFDTTGRGRREAHLEAFRKARRAADKAKVAFKTSNIADWRRLLDTPLAGLSDVELLEAVAELCDARHLTISDAYIIIGSAA